MIVVVYIIVNIAFSKTKKHLQNCQKTKQKTQYYSLTMLRMYICSLLFLNAVDAVSVLLKPVDFNTCIYHHTILSKFYQNLCK